MADLKIRVFKGRESVPETTVTVPGSVLKIASKLIPKRAAEPLQERGIDLDEIIKLAENPDARGTLIEVEDEEEREDRHRFLVASAPAVAPVDPPFEPPTTLRDHPVGGIMCTTRRMASDDERPVRVPAGCDLDQGVSDPLCRYAV